MDHAAAFDAWARASGPSLLRFATAVSGNPHDGADRVQDALAAVFPRWLRLAGDGAADARLALANIPPDQGCRRDRPDHRTHGSHGRNLPPEACFVGGP